MAMLSVKRTKMREFKGPTPHSVAILAKNPGKNPQDKIILDSRKRFQDEEERKLNDRMNQDMDVRSEWEQKSAMRVMKARLQREVGSLMKVEEFKVNDRREKLRKLLAEEDAAYIEEMLSKEETLLERQAKMRERARQLKEKREQERLVVVQQKYDQLFKNDCEELRSTLTRRFEDEIHVNNVEMLRVKAEQEREKEREEKMYADLWQKDLEEKMAKEERDLQAKTEMNRDALVVQQKQIAAVKEQEAKEKALKEEEAQLLAQQKELLDLEAQRALEFKHQRQRAMRNMLDSAVSQKAKMVARQQQEELAFDLKQLEKLLQDTKDEEIWRRKRKAELRDEDKTYRDHLAYMLEVEKQKEKELNDLIQEELDKAAAQKAEKMRQEREARRRLLSDVLAARDEQIKHRLRENAKKQEDALRERQELEELLAENAIKEKLEAERRWTQKLDYRADLTGQCAYDAANLTDEHQRDRDEYESCQKAECEYQQKIIDVLNNIENTNYHPTTRAIMNRYHQKQKSSI